jgi:hypothetical protein
MGKLIQGINGPFTGRVGPVIGTSWMGMPVIKSRPQRGKRKFSTAELAQQAKFKKMSAFLSPVMTLLNVTFKPLAVRMTGFNKGYSYNVKNAFAGVYPELRIDYSMILLGRGDLPNAGSPSAISNLTGNLDFTWADNSGKGIALGTDKAFIAAYCEEQGYWVYELNAADRVAGGCTLAVNDFIGKRVHTYIGFISADGKEVSDSIYTGMIAIN